MKFSMPNVSHTDAHRIYDLPIIHSGHASTTSVPAWRRKRSSSPVYFHERLSLVMYEILVILRYFPFHQ